MPSRVRLFYHGLRSSNSLTTDRDLDLAITEFAPGSPENQRQTRLPGYRVHCTSAAPEQRLVPHYEQPFVLSRWMSRCGQCHYTATHEAEPQDDYCPHCGCASDSDPAFRTFQFAVPMAFRASLGRVVMLLRTPSFCLRGLHSCRI